ncbi:MAG: hypothetical protein IJR24_05355, partial [Alloprevotella sp.]|nr:hypothetical protein [Alloprevotella sp.]
MYVSFIFFIPVVAGAKIQYKFRKLHFLRAGSKKGQYIKPELMTLAFASILSVATQHLKGIVQDAVRHSSLLALLAKFRYALGLPSFATRFACKELPALTPTLT